jgi:hypothetical protein
VNRLTFDLHEPVYDRMSQQPTCRVRMQRVVLTVWSGGEKEILECALEPNRGEHPLACLVGLRGAVFLTGCRIRSARVIESSGATWVAPSSLLERLNRSLA